MGKYPTNGVHAFPDVHHEQDVFEYTKLAKEQVDDFLLSHGVDTEYIKRLDLEQRSTYLISVFFGESNVTSNGKEDITIELDGDVGMLLVKPEIFPYESKVAAYLEENNFEVILLDKVHPTHDEWTSIYGYMLKDYPDIINLYVMQRSLGFRPILFKHPTIETYISLLEAREQAQVRYGDKDTMFDQLFCGKAADDTPMTLRSDIAYPLLRQLGFDDMSGYASLFDPVDYFKDTGMSKNYRAYNGIHIPSNATEKQRNLDIFLKRDNRDA